MKVQFNEKLFENIEDKYKDIAEIFLYLVYRDKNPIDFFSRLQGGLDDVNYCINTFTRYGIVEYQDDDNEGSFVLKRPLFINGEMKQEYNVNEIRKYFTKSYLGEIHRNATKEHTEYLILKFLEKHPYKWEDIVHVTGEFMTKVKKDNPKYAPSIVTYIEKYLLIGLEELALGKELSIPTGSDFNDFLL